MTKKKMLVVVGGLLAVLVLLTGIESLVPRESRAARRESGEARPPIVPTLDRPDPRTIVLMAGTFSQTRWLYDEDDSIEHVDGVYACLEEGIRREFEENPTSRRSGVTARLKSIQDDCTN